MLFFREMRQNEALPVEIERIGRAFARKDEAAPALERFEQEVDLGIVAQRLIMADALHGCGDRFTVEDTALAERDLQPEAAAAETLEYLQLHLAHELHADLARGLIVHDMQQRILFLEQTQLFEHRVRIGLLRVDAVSEYRLEQRSALSFFRAERVAAVCGGQPRYGAYRSGFCRIGQLVFFPGVETDLVDLLLGLAVLRRNLYRSAGAKLSARNTQPREPGALRVAADLIHPRAEGVPGGLDRRIECERIEQLFHAVEPKRCAEQTREELFLRDQAADFLRRDRPGGKEALERRFALGRSLFHPVRAGKVRALR